MTLIHDSSGKGVGLENPLPTKVIESTIMQPIDIQSRYQQTIQTHNAVSVPLSSYSISSAWIDCNGFDKLAITFINDANTTSSVDVQWSNDGVTQHGLTNSVVPSSTTSVKDGIVDIRARYVKLVVVNGDAALAHTMSAWLFLKA